MLQKRGSIDSSLRLIGGVVGMFSMLTSSQSEKGRFVVGTGDFILGYLRVRNALGTPSSGLRVTVSPRSLPVKRLDKLFYGGVTVELITDEGGYAEYSFVRGALLDVHIHEREEYFCVDVPEYGESFDILSKEYRREA